MTSAHLVRFSPHEVHSRAARAAGRIAWIVENRPAVSRIEVCVSERGHLLVREHVARDYSRASLLGVYGRDVTISQLVSDLAEDLE